MVESKDRYEELWIGKDKDKESVKLNPSGMLRHHTIVIGQSGSGKSFTLGRLIEEMVLHTYARIVILDLNADFGRLNQVNGKAWDAGNNPKLVQNLLTKEYGLDESPDNFALTWQEECSDFLPISAVPEESSNLKISWERLTEAELRQLLGLIPFEHPEATWLLELLTKQAKLYGWTVEQWEQIGSLVVSWSRGHFPKIDEESQRLFGKLQRHISMTTSVSASQQIATSLSDALRYGIWNRTKEPTCFDKILEQRPVTTDNLPRVTCVNLASVSKEPARLLVVRYILDRLWNAAAEDRWQAITQDRDNGRRPVFVVVDEVHRIASQKAEGAAEGGVLEVMRQIAAEGRKQGLLLIVATQRPSKLQSDVLSECDNVCVMRLVSGADIKLLKERLSFREPARLEAAKEFVTGEAIFGGEWTNGKTVWVDQVATRRTVESGGDLPQGNFVRHVKAAERSDLSSSHSYSEEIPM